MYKAHTIGVCAVQDGMTAEVGAMPFAMADKKPGYDLFMRAAWAAAALSVARV